MVNLLLLGDILNSAEDRPISSWGTPHLLKREVVLRGGVGSQQDNRADER